MRLVQLWLLWDDPMGVPAEPELNMRIYLSQRGCDL